MRHCPLPLGGSFRYAWWCVVAFRADARTPLHKSFLGEAHKKRCASVMARSLNTKRLRNGLSSQQSRCAFEVRNDVCLANRSFRLCCLQFLRDLSKSRMVSFPKGRWLRARTWDSDTASVMHNLRCAHVACNGSNSAKCPFWACKCLHGTAFWLFSTRISTPNPENCANGSVSPACIDWLSPCSVSVVYPASALGQQQQHRTRAPYSSRPCAHGGIRAGTHCGRACQ